MTRIGRSAASKVLQARALLLCDASEHGPASFYTAFLPEEAPLLGKSNEMLDPGRSIGSLKRLMQGSNSKEFIREFKRYRVLAFGDFLAGAGSAVN